MDLRRIFGQLEVPIFFFLFCRTNYIPHFSVLIYDMVVGKTPWRAANTNTLYKKILNDKLQFPQYLTGLKIKRRQLIASLLRIFCFFFLISRTLCIDY